MKKIHFQMATFAGGCFWCMEPPFTGIEGVINQQVGYTGGEGEDPTYEEVSTGDTGHVEAIQILFDESKVTYEHLLHLFFFNIDPLDSNGQFVDRGSQYRTAIFYHTEDQRKRALKVIEELKLARHFSKIETIILPFRAFYPAEEWHQRFYQKNPEHYERYKKGSGRQERLKEIWGPQDGCGPCGGNACGI
jgi:methionine-S-sulfoxide reductase